MKKSTLLFVVLVSALSNLQAQPNVETRHTVRTGLNGAFYGWGDGLGHAMWIDYAYRFNDYIAVGPRVMTGYSRGMNDTDFDFLTTYGAAVSVRVTPLPRIARWFGIEAGLLYQNYSKVYGSVSYIWSGNGYEERREAFADKAVTDTFGFIASLNFNLFENHRFAVGLRGDMLTSLEERMLNCDSWQIGASLGVKF